MRKSLNRSTLAIFASAGLVVAACGSDSDDTSEEPPAVEEEAPADADTAATDEPAAADDADAEADAAPAQADDASTEVPTIVVTTNILGDVVEEIVGDAAEVVTMLPVGADPHDFQASAQEVDTMMSADALIVNGGNLEEGLVDVIEAAEDDGVATFAALSAVETIEFGEGGDGHDHGDEDHDHGDDEHSDEEHGDEDHDHGDEEHDHGDEDKDEDHDHGDEDHDHGDEEHSDEEHGDEDHDHGDEEHSDEEHGDEHGHDDHGHDHSGEDPHFWTDPMRMADAVEGIVGFLQDTVEFADPSAVSASADAYLAELTALNDEITALIAAVPEGDRKLVTNHLAYGYFADVFGFEQVGAVIPSGSTLDTTSGGDLAELVEVIEAEGVPAIFSDNTASDELIQVLADEAGGVTVVELYSGSLGEAGSAGETYLSMQRTNAERISAALA